MVKIKLTSVFILAAFVIAPIVGHPFPASPGTQLSDLTPEQVAELEK